MKIHLKISLIYSTTRIQRVLTFVSATLFTLLSLKSFRMKAKEYGLADIITYLKESSSQDYLVQLGYIEDLLKLNDDEKDQDDD